ncbi:hypothetical protein SELMODRAFT_419909 [Selaginella moellendorffii]|uniref:Uncharacterized protein n=1 Tax=Selaginella moellendorffii TaxID=88036 RepID=D8SAX5_SELML|nr:hypothetical protein SELMODRAFT_419909 [Selaginella moellendorffii]
MKLVPFSCGGKAQNVSADPVKLVYKGRVLELPISSDLPYPKVEFKDGGRAWCLSPEDVLTNFQLENFGIVQKAGHILKPDSVLQAKLEQVRIYGAGDFTRENYIAGQTSNEAEQEEQEEKESFVLEPDEESSNQQVGKLEVILPGTYTGGEVVITSCQGKKHVSVATNESTTFRWVGFTTDAASVEVREVKSGYRVSLIYKLYKATWEAEVDSFPQGILKSIQEAAADLKDKEKLVYACVHDYPCTHQHVLKDEYEDVTYDDVVPLLKGSDSSVYHAMKDAGLQVKLCGLVEFESETSDEIRYGLHNGFPGLQMIQEHFDFNYEDRGISEYAGEECRAVVPRFLHKDESRGIYTDGWGAFEMVDHKRGYMNYVKKRMVLTGEESSRDDAAKKAKMS